VLEPVKPACPVRPWVIGLLLLGLGTGLQKRQVANPQKGVPKFVSFSSVVQNGVLTWRAV